MAKKFGPKHYVGKILKGKKKDDGTFMPDQMVVDIDSFTLKKGMFLKLVSPVDEIKGYEEAVEAGRMTEDKAMGLIEKCEKKKKHTRFTIVYQEVSDE